MGLRTRFRGRWAHPRACGENSTVKCMATSFWGSSPRMRGKLIQGDKRLTARGLIPAHAGKTEWSLAGATAHPAHPRACGENPPFEFLLGGGAGSSPRMRGKRGGEGVGHRGFRLIPAHAGKTWLLRAARSHFRAHPRACGENMRSRVQLACFPGSSPRMRGKLELSVDLTLHDRLIPAHAGKTSSRSRRFRRRRAHPRACGENLSLSLGFGFRAGSSPRMRGKLADLADPPVEVRLIPAHAGKTTVSGSTSIRSKAHPRACGEN